MMQFLHIHLLIFSFTIYLIINYLYILLCTQFNDFLRTEITKTTNVNHDYNLKDVASVM